MPCHDMDMAWYVMTRSTPAAQRVVADARAVVLEERQRVREDERADRAFGARPDLGGGGGATLEDVRL